MIQYVFCFVMQTNTALQNICEGSGTLASKKSTFEYSNTKKVYIYIYIYIIIIIYK